MTAPTSIDPARFLHEQLDQVLVTQTITATGLGRELSVALAPWRKPLAVHDPGKVLTDLAITLALGGDCLADIALLRAEPGFFGLVASDPTAPANHWRTGCGSSSCIACSVTTCDSTGIAASRLRNSRRPPGRWARWISTPTNMADSRSLVAVHTAASPVERYLNEIVEGGGLEADVECPDPAIARLHESLAYTAMLPDGESADVIVTVKSADGRYSFQESP